MGAASSSDHGSSSFKEVQEEESLAASTGSLPILSAAFANFSGDSGDSASHSVPLSSLQQTFCVPTTNVLSHSSPIPEGFPQLLDNIGVSVADLFFAPTKGESIDWFGFLRGYNQCRPRTPTSSSSSLTVLYKLYSIAASRAGISCDLEFDADLDKVGGRLSAADVVMFLWMCWILMSWSKIPKRGTEDEVVLPDVNSLVLSAFVSSGEIRDDASVWNCDVLGSGKSVEAHKFHMWALSMAPGLARCLPPYLQERIQDCAVAKGAVDPSAASGTESSTSGDTHDTFLLTCGGAWAISLTLRHTLSDDFSGACFSGASFQTLENLLYRSSIHGKGLSRFWSNLEGYNGPVLVLISGNSAVTYGSDNNAGIWVIGILTGQGFENRDAFYGSSGNLYAISPIFRVLSPSGKDKNFVYCHLHPSMRVYEPHPKPVGLAFGGTIGNERFFIDEDFAKVTIRHHAVDKTYQPGSLIPNQGYLATEASILEVEVWGLGGEAAKGHQDAYKKRELLFSEQRRKVDLKTFGSWEDSPEKMMMDMVADPNRVQRGDR